MNHDGAIPSDTLAWPLLALAVPTGLLVWAAMLGLGVARQGDAMAVSLSSAGLVFGPAVLVGMASRHRRLSKVAIVQLVWATAVFLSMPVYFPGERREAVATGLSVVMGDPDGSDVARSVADVLPDEPEVSVAQVPEARPVELEVLPPAKPLDAHEIALPYEGEGRRLSVPVVFEHNGRTVETFMMLDTGATYTTLPMSVLDALGLVPNAGDPELTLHTANGERTARVKLLDRVWLGDLDLDGVAITACEDCASEDNAGLLGLNVTGGYNITIDADRREVIFSRRATFNRRLDVRPYARLQGRFVQYAAGRVEAAMTLDNTSDRPIASATARVSCGDDSWVLPLGQVASRAVADVRRRLPSHPRCDSYQLELHEADW